MKGKRGIAKYYVHTSDNAGERERAWAKMGLAAGSCAACLVAVAIIAIAYPSVFATVIALLIGCGIGAAYLFRLSQDLDFNGDLRE